MMKLLLLKDREKRKEKDDVVFKQIQDMKKKQDFLDI